MRFAATRSNFPGIGSAVDATLVDSDDQSNSDSIELIVPEGAEVLFVTLTDDGPTGYLRAPSRAELVVVDPKGERRPDLIHRGSSGQYTLVTEQPEPGRWTITVWHSPGASAELNAAVYQPEAVSKLQRLGKLVRCKACKYLFKTAVVALLVHVGPLIASGIGLGAALAQVATTAGAVLAAAQRTLGIAYDGLKALFDFIDFSIDDPIDRQLGRVCQFLKACEG